MKENHINNPEDFEELPEGITPEEYGEVLGNYLMELIEEKRKTLIDNVSKVLDKKRETEWDYRDI